MNTAKQTTRSSLSALRTFARPLVIIITAFITTVTGSHLAHAEQMKSFGPLGNYEAHYIIIPSSFIPAEVAKLYSITRSRDRMILNVSIRKKESDGSSQEQVASIKGSRKDLMGIEYSLKFHEIKEQGAIYYLADFLVLNEEFSRFTIEVTLPQEKLSDESKDEQLEETFTLKFEQKMYFGL